jgi:hypothetical protein
VATINQDFSVRFIEGHFNFGRGAPRTSHSAFASDVFGFALLLMRRVTVCGMWCVGAAPVCKFVSLLRKI